MTINCSTTENVALMLNFLLTPLSKFTFNVRKNDFYNIFSKYNSFFVYYTITKNCI